MGILIFLWNFVLDILPLLLAGMVVAVLLMVAYTKHAKRVWTWVSADQTALFEEEGTAEVTENFQNLLEEAKEACFEHSGKHMRMLCVMPCDKLEALTMRTSFRCTKLIIYSPVWIYRAAVGSCDAMADLWKIAFMQSVGHELGHQFDKRKGFGFCFRKKTNKRLFRWLREIQCDFYSLRFLADEFDDYDSDLVLAAVGAKALIYTERNGDRATNSHPTWVMRREIMTYASELSKDIIDLVADAAGCTDRAFIEKMYVLYGV